jgi:hypothetical protein
MPLCPLRALFTLVAAAALCASSCGTTQGNSLMPPSTMRDMNEEQANCHLACRDTCDECKAVCGSGTADAERCVSDCESRRFACDDAC